MITAEELAKEIHLIDDIRPDFAMMIATGLLPFLQAQITAAAEMRYYDIYAIAVKVTGDQPTASEIAKRLATPQPPKDANSDIVREAIAILRNMPTDRIEYNEELSALVRKLKPDSPKNAGTVPMPERYSFRTNPPLPGHAIPAGDGQWCKVADVIAYGDAREAAGRADAVPAQAVDLTRAGIGGPSVTVVFESQEAADRYYWKTQEAMQVAQNLEQHPPAEPAAPAADNDPVQVERGLLGAACAAIAKKRDAPKVLEALRKITMTPREEPAARAQVMGEQSMLSEYVADYEYRGEDGEGRGACYTPNERERLLIEDAILGWDEYRKDAAHPSPAHAGSGDADNEYSRIYAEVIKVCADQPMANEIARRLAGGKA